MRLISAAVAMVAASCTAALDLPDGASVRCSTSAQCPAGWTCDATAQRCLPDGEDDRQAPTLERATLSPQWGRTGTVVTLTLTASEILATTPDVSLAGVNGLLHFDPNDGEGADHTLTYAVQGPGVEPEGVQQLRIVMADYAGNEAEDNSQSLTIDFTPPDVISLAPLDEQRLLVNWSEPLDPATAQDTSLYSANGGLTLVGANLDASGAGVVLLIEGAQGAVSYDVTFSGVADPAGNAFFGSRAFVAPGQAIDDTPPELLAPADGHRMAVGDVRLQWESRSAASSYTVEVASDAAFSALLFGGPLTQSTTVPERTVMLGAEGRYYWRVKADTTNAAAVLTSRFIDVLGDTVDVYCPSGMSCDPGFGVGNAQNPVRSVSEAVRLATALGRAHIRIAGRSGGEAYPGEIDLGPGLLLEGGYAPDFLTRDLAMYPTRIESPSFGLWISNAVDTHTAVTVDGLEIQGVSGGLFGVVVVNCNDALVLRDLQIAMGSSNSLSYAVQLLSSGTALGSGPLLERVDAVAGPATSTSVGLYLADSSPTITNSSARGGAGSSGYGALVTHGSAPQITDSQFEGNNYGMRVSHGSSPNISDSQITGSLASPATTTYGLRIDDNAGAVTLLDSVVVSRDQGAYIFGGASHVIVGNEFRGAEVAAGSISSIGVSMATVSSLPVFSGNIISANPDEPAGVGLSIGGDSMSDPTVIEGNTISGTTAVKTGHSDAILLNNVILGESATGGTVTGVSFNQVVGSSASSLTLANNTIVVNGDARGVYLTLSYDAHSPILVNNLIVTVDDGSGSNRYGIYENVGTFTFAQPAEPIELRNNLIVHLAGTGSVYDYRDEPDDGDIALVVADSADDEIDSELQTEGFGGASVCACTISGNITYGTTGTPGGLATLADLFEDPGGTLTPLDATDDYRPVAGALAYINGLNLHGNPAFGSPTADASGAPRPTCAIPICETTTPPWTIGAVQ